MLVERIDQESAERLEITHIPQRQPCAVQATPSTQCKNAVGLVLEPATQRGGRQVLHKFQAEIKHSPPVTMVHTLTWPRCAPGDARVILARNVADAVLVLIETYMCDGVRRQVSVCNCARGGSPADS